MQRDREQLFDDSLKRFCECANSVGWSLVAAALIGAPGRVVDSSMSMDNHGALINYGAIQRRGRQHGDCVSRRHGLRSVDACQLSVTNESEPLRLRNSEDTGLI
jgi:hypothetical protein